MKIAERKTCRASGGVLIDVFDLGMLPISCFPLATDPAPELTPLALCLNQESGLVQLKHTIAPNDLYKEYWYISGINSSMTMALKNIADKAQSLIKLQDGDIVLDIASNDWTLLKNYPKYVQRVGIDPSNIKPNTELCPKDVFINDYFTAAAYYDRVRHKAKIITSICVLYDLDNPIKFASDVKKVLDDDGLWIAEMSYLPTMLENNSVETICGEHLEYYSLQSLEYILHKAGMAVEDIEFNDVNGGSFRIYIRHADKAVPTPAVINTRIKERELGLDNLSIYNAFAQRIQYNKQEMVAFLKQQKDLGKTVIGYGASTKGNTMMAYYGINSDLVSCVADRNPMKFGRTTVTGIPIVSEQKMRDMKPDYLLVFAYHFIDEFINREREFLKNGGQFVVPIPKIKFIGDECMI